jgi:hypothetical protein
MTQHQVFQLFLPILIVLPVMYFRMRRMARAQPLKLNRMWIRPAFFLAIAALVLLAPPSSHHPERVLVALDFAWLALAGALGAVAGWQWGRTMAIEVHPENGTLMMKGGQAAAMVLVVLILFRLGLRAGLSVEAKAWHINMLLVSDASIIFTAFLFTLRSVEMYLRAKQVMARAQRA